jgi:hypothetical protein
VTKGVLAANLVVEQVEAEQAPPIRQFKSLKILGSRRSEAYLTHEHTPEPVRD